MCGQVARRFIKVAKFFERESAELYRGITMTNGFYCLPSIIEALDLLDVEAQKEAAWAVLRYGGFKEVRRDISAPAKVLLTMAIPNIDAAIKRQQERAEQQSKRGKREGKRASKKHFANERNYTAEQLNKMLGDTTNFDDI